MEIGAEKNVHLFSVLAVGLAGVFVLDCLGCSSDKVSGNGRCIVDSDCPGSLICGQVGASFGKCVECDSDGQCSSGQRCSSDFRCISSDEFELPRDGDDAGISGDADSKYEPGGEEILETKPEALGEGFKEELAEIFPDADTKEDLDLGEAGSDEEPACIPSCTGKCPGAADGCGGECKENSCNGCCQNTECLSFMRQSVSACGPAGSVCMDCTVAAGNRVDRCLDGACSCGNTSKVCDAGWTCLAGECKPGCEPDCSGKCAGADDGCGGDCPVSDCPNACCESKCCEAGQVCYAGACCTKQSCFQLGFECGIRTDGCGGTQDCGTCGSMEHCSNSGQCECDYVECGSKCCGQGEVCFNGACCRPKTCAGLGKQCGTWDDGCGGALDCGGCGSAPADTCSDGQTLRHFVEPLRCVQGECKMDYVDLHCTFGCSNGECNTCDYDCGGVMNVWTRWYIPGWQDRMVSATQWEECTGCVQEGQGFYVPVSSGPGRRTIYRLFSEANTDHMLSGTSGEGGYTTEAVFGYAFTSSHEGLSEIPRWYNPSTGDHTVGFPLDNLDSLGYQKEHVMGYAYFRGSMYWTIPYTSRGSLVSLDANMIAGGAVSGLTWNNKQFVNNFDFGRQVQIAFNLSSTAEQDNPTEGGDRLGAPGIKDAPYAHGSQIIYVDYDDSHMETACLPLQWRPELHGGGEDHPVMWDGTIGKRIDLDFNGWPDVMRWTTKVVFPRRQTYLNMELVTAYLNGDFTRFYTYDAIAGRRTEKTAGIPRGGCVDPSQDADQRPSAGGVLISTADAMYALGVYHNGPEVVYGLCNFLNQGGGTTTTDASTSKWNALYRPAGGIQAGTFVKTLYLVIGTVEGVTQRMHDLYQAGY